MQRSADTYRGARRNTARSQGKLNQWRLHPHAHTANLEAKISERREMADAANKAVSLALAAAGPLASQSVANHAYLEFYRNQPRSRVVSRIIRQLEAAIRAKRAA
jgi:hypothetical protein